MAPVLFNLFAAAVMERWHARLDELGITGFPMKFSLDGQLFKRSTRGSPLLLRDGEFADDAVLFAKSHANAGTVLQAFVDVGAAFGLTVNMIKTVFMAVGYGIDNLDRLPLLINSKPVTHVDHFRYLGSVVTPDGRYHADVSARLAAASRAFGSLLAAVFQNPDLSPTTKQRVYTRAVCSRPCYMAPNVGSLYRPIFAASSHSTTDVSALSLVSLGGNSGRTTFLQLLYTAPPTPNPSLPWFF